MAHSLKLEVIAEPRQTRLIEHQMTKIRHDQPGFAVAADVSGFPLRSALNRRAVIVVRIASRATRSSASTSVRRGEAPQV